MSNNQQRPPPPEYSLFSIPPMSSSSDSDSPQQSPITLSPTSPISQPPHHRIQQLPHASQLQSNDISSLDEPLLFDIPDNDNHDQQMLLNRKDNRRRLNGGVDAEGRMTAFAMKKQALLNLQSNVLELIDSNETLIRKQQRLERELAELKATKLG